METMQEVKAVLFDFDGVVVDTETQYSVFWHKQGMEFLGMNDLESRIKGQTLTYIYDTFFFGMEREQQEITGRLNRFELQEMSYDYIPGALSFIEELRNRRVKMAIVTSSNQAKMAVVYRHHPELKQLFDRILTAEMFAASKPAPDCFLLGMKEFGSNAENTYVFEDSFNGLKAGMASGATVIGVATTNSRDSIASLCHHMIDDFRDFSYEKMLQVNK